MSKNIKDYLSLYLGCQVLVQGEERKGYLTGVNNGGHECEIQYQLADNPHHLEEEPEFASAEDVKMVLRPLSDMTEEEFTEAVMLHWGTSRDIIKKTISKIERLKEVKQITKYGTSIPYVAFDKEGKHYMTATFSQNSMNPEQTLYLLSKHFDLFNLIPEGLAIDKTKI